MPPKVYVTNYPAGDFRAMPALGDGHALLKWISSFPGQSNARAADRLGSGAALERGDRRARGGLRCRGRDRASHRRRGRLAAETLGRANAGTAAVVGAGVNGRAAARMFLDRGRSVSIWDLDPARAKLAAEELGATPASSLEEALAADLLVTVTPGRDVLLAEGSLSAGQHVSLMGADGPGKAEIAPAELARTRIFCDDWEQASHGGELAQAFDAGSCLAHDVGLIGAVLAGEAEGRREPWEITTFDSTGLAIQDLAIAIACFEQAAGLDLPTLTL